MTYTVNKKMTFLAALMLCISSFCANAQSADEERKYLRGLLQPGTEAPDFTFENAGDFTGHRFSELRGRCVVLDFWASWCPDCRRDIPELKSLYQQFASDSIVFVSVSFDKDKDVWLKCVRDSGMTWIQHSELKAWKQTQISKDYSISWIPTIYLIAPDGRVAAATINAKMMEPVLRQYVETGHFPNVGNAKD